MKHFYVAEVDTWGCEVEFYLNDVPMLRRGPLHGEQCAGPVHHGLIDGENEMGVIVQPGPQPSSALRGEVLPRSWQADQRQWATATLHRYPHGAVVGSPDGEQLASLRFELDDGDTERPFPRVAATRFDLGAMFGPWSWQRAQPLTLDSRVTQEVVAFLQPLHEAMSHGNFAPWIDALAHLHSEWERAYELPRLTKALEVMKAIEMDRAERKWNMQPFDATRLDLRLCGERRLVECVARDGKPLFRTTAEQGRVSHFPAILGRLDGAWRILR